MRCSERTPVSPACWLCILPSVRCLPSGWTIGLRCRPSPQALTLDWRPDHPIFTGPHLQHEERAPALPDRWPDPLAWDTVGWLGLASLHGPLRHGEDLGAAKGDQAGAAGSQTVLP